MKTPIGSLDVTQRGVRTHYEVYIEDDGDGLLNGTDTIGIRKTDSAHAGADAQTVTDVREKRGVLSYMGFGTDEQGRPAIRKDGQSIANLRTYTEDFARTLHASSHVAPRNVRDIASFDAQLGRLHTEAVAAGVDDAPALNALRRERAMFLLGRATEELDRPHGDRGFARRLVAKAEQLARDGGFADDSDFLARIPVFPRPGDRPALDL